ncbi:MAG: beta-ketoacyl synthase chain length factor [Spirochaetales bacterium]|nr:beta-ketoacyl synthase chain length factor [Spirochaetales bacterium]
MSETRLFLLGRAVWAPGLETADAAAAWAHGETAIKKTTDTPRLEFLPPLSRRRLSQLSRMVIEVGHRLTSGGPSLPCVFASRYGEINRQYAISASLLDAGEVGPAVFSLSVFNTPVYLLSIAEKNTAAGSALCAGAYGLAGAFLDALGFLRPGSPDVACLVLFADEALPPDYLPLFGVSPEPYAFGLVLSSRRDPSALPLTLTMSEAKNEPEPVHPLKLLRWLETGAGGSFAFGAPGIDLTIEAGAPC